MPYGLRIGFAFSTKDRVEFTRRSLASIDTDEGFDLVWVDGSVRPEGRRLPHEVRLQNARIVRVYQGIGGGPDIAIRFGLRRLIDLDYDLCGLIENDIVFEPGWFASLTALFERGAQDGLRVGAATVRTFASRVLFYRSDYAGLYNLGAGVVLLTREAAKTILAAYNCPTAREVGNFFSHNFGADLTVHQEFGEKRPHRRLSGDWGYAQQLYKYGFVSVGSLPTMARNFDLDAERMAHSKYMTEAPAPTAEDEAIFKRVRDYTQARRRVLFVRRDILLGLRYIVTAPYWNVVFRSAHLWRRLKRRLKKVPYVETVYRRVRRFV